jgi:hypothetical protein
VAVLDRVGGEVQQHLLEALAVGVDGQGAVGGGGGLDGDLPFGGQRPDEVGGLGVGLQQGDEPRHLLGQQRG